MPPTACGLEVSDDQSLLVDNGVTLLDFPWVLLLTFDDNAQMEAFAGEAEVSETAFGVAFVRSFASPQLSMEFDDSHSLNDVCSAYYRLGAVGPFASAVIILRTG